MSGVWVLGYGSLVSAESFGATLGRELRLGTDLLPAEVAGYQRRWNYGIRGRSGWWTDDDGVEHERTIVALGVVPAPDEAVNGVVVRLSDQELVLLDRRERHYDRVDVTSSTTAPDEVDGPIVTYVPQAEAIEHYASARDRGVAAIERRYWNLVERAFAALGPGQLQRFRATTPAPDVPVLDIVRPT